MKKLCSVFVALAMILSMCPNVGAISTEVFWDDGMTISYTQYGDEKAEAVVESESVRATTIREGNILHITTEYKNEDGRVLEIQEVEVDLDVIDDEITMEILPEDSSVAPHSAAPVRWMSQHYDGDGYQVWPSSGAYLLIVDEEEIYTGTSMGSVLKNCVRVFTSNVKDADEYYQAACEGLVDLLPVVGAAKAIAQLIGAMGGVNDNEETWLSCLSTIVGVAQFPTMKGVVENSMRSSECHELYIEAYNNAYRYCTPW